MIGKVVEHPTEGLGVDSGHQPPVGLARLWANKPIQPEPLEAPLHRGHSRGIPVKPFPTQHGFEAYSLFILSPDFDDGVGMALLNLLDGLGEIFFPIPLPQSHQRQDSAVGAL